MLPISNNQHKNKKNTLHISLFKSSKAGFTLIEIIIAINIAIILFLIMTAVYNISQKAYQKTDTQSEITQNGRVILDRMIRELRQTQGIVTTIPETNSDPDTLPEEIIFQDGHDKSQISYIRYYLDTEQKTINRQIIKYYFESIPDIYVYWHDKDEFGNSPTKYIMEDRIIGEFVYDIEFWGENLININLYLLKNSETITINTSIYGRNL